MRLLQIHDDGELSLTEFPENPPPYAILSHTWGEDYEEVIFRNIMEGGGKDKAGYSKIRFCARQASQDGLKYIWVDTCCIDKSSSAELSEAINSMFSWYQNSARCYVYLSDVRKSLGEIKLKSDFQHSRWFTRSWTLQELLAPTSVDFFTADGDWIGDKSTLELEIVQTTGISAEALRGTPLSQFSVDERKRWAAGRSATREEDIAYSLLGIFDVNMPLLYGEGGNNALKRLLREITANFPETQSAIGEVPTYSQLTDSEFRILVVELGEQGDYINVGIRIADLQDPPIYNALSYVWGHEPAIHRINVDGKIVRIRPNLFQALQRIRPVDKAMYIWVDSLCINQSDGLERNAQVRRMADIYRKASNVFIWLGEADLTSEQAMDFIPRINRVQFKWESRWWEEPDVIAFCHLLGRPWFRRGWVLQEAAFSANSIIFCGDRHVRMVDFVRAVSNFRNQLDSGSVSFGDMGKHSPPKDFVVNFHNLPAPRLLDTIEEVFSRPRNENNLQRTMSLETLVELGTFAETTDPRDAIYCLLNLANDVDSSSPSESAIIPDYRRPVLDVFTGFVLHCCHQSGSLDIICRPWAPVWSSVSHVIGELSHSTRMIRTDIPSWIARRDALPFGDPARGLTHRIQGKPLVGTSRKQVYNAHYRTEPQVRIGQNMVQDCDGSLYAKGIILGRTTHVSTRMADAIITKECLEIITPRGIEGSMSSLEVLDVYWRTVCADRDDQGGPPPPSYPQSMLYILEKFALLQSHVHQIDLSDLMSGIDIDDILESEKIPHSVRSFLETTRNVIWNRRTFRGSRFDGSRRDIMGMVPRQAKTGDYVCILFGCSVPVVLRRQLGENGAVYWRLIGEAYVYGAMDGEEISPVPQAELKSIEKEFKIR